MHKRIVDGVTVDDTFLYEKIEHWKKMYEREIIENLKLHREINILKKSINNHDIKCDKCNGNMKYIDQFKTYVCMTCGNMK
jgi:DNA-directed RNA polymerase subunit RPC12/RpoP